MAAIKPIRTEGDLEQALERIDRIFDAEEGTPRATNSMSSRFWSSTTRMSATPSASLPPSPPSSSAWNRPS